MPSELPVDQEGWRGRCRDGDRLDRLETFCAGPPTVSTAKSFWAGGLQDGLKLWWEREASKRIGYHPWTHCTVSPVTVNALRMAVATVSIEESAAENKPHVVKELTKPTYPPIECFGGEASQQA